jgi:hypothetical protein
MDLLSSIRKSGSRGGVNFSWDEVSTSQHRENYLGHSIMAPVGRWQKGKDLSWYAKGDEKEGKEGETAEEKKIRERKEEITRIKEAEEDALARALGLPVAERGVTGANAISVGEVNRAVKEAGVGEDEEEERARGFGEFVGKVQGGAEERDLKEPEKGGLVKVKKEREGKREERSRSRSRSRERKHRRHRHRSRSGERRRHRSRSGDRNRHRRKQEEREERRSRSRSVDRKEERRPRSRSVDRRVRRYRSRSRDTYKGAAYRGDRRDTERPRRSRSPEFRDRGRRDRDFDRRR